MNKVFTESIILWNSVYKYIRYKKCYEIGTDNKIKNSLR